MVPDLSVDVEDQDFLWMNLGGDVCKLHWDLDNGWHGFGGRGLDGGGVGRGVGRGFGLLVGGGGGRLDGT